jgi:hypothetical protein
VEASHTDEKMGRAELGGPAPPGRYPEPLGECSGGCRRYRLSPIAGRFGNYLDAIAGCCGKLLRIRARNTATLHIAGGSAKYNIASEWPRSRNGRSVHRPR